MKARGGLSDRITSLGCARSQVNARARLRADPSPLDVCVFVLHFPAGGLPPNNAFWSLTMADAQNHFVANPINRYSVSDRSRFVQNSPASFWPALSTDVVQYIASCGTYIEPRNILLHAAGKRMPSPGLPHPNKVVQPLTFVT